MPAKPDKPIEPEPPQEAPSIEEVFRDTPLYQVIPLGDEPRKFLYSLVAPEIKIDLHCAGCGKDSVFFSVAKQVHYANFTDGNFRFFERVFHCSRNATHRIAFYFQLHNGLTKVGQSTSLADLSAVDLKKYVKVIPAEDYRELVRAVGLASHGIGIGAFVYLRRIFERLLNQASVKAATREGWDAATYSKARIGEKIDLLHDLLPSFLVENKGLYGILSKGVHELSEEDCLAAYHPVHVAIELILDQKLAEKTREEKEQAARKRLTDLQSKLAKRT